MALADATPYDALIVGAGPAGAHLAFLLARRGQRVALLERKRFPREKVCGGGLSRKAMDLLGCDLAPVMHTTIRGAYLALRGGPAVVKDIAPAAGCTVVRSEFDQFLVERACRAGAEFLPETDFVDLALEADRVIVKTSRGELRASRLFGADGIASSVRSKVFGRKGVHAVPALEALVRLPDADLAGFGKRALFDFGGMSHGYGWIFPKADHLNVGIYSPRGGNAMRRQLDQFMSYYPLLQRRSNVSYRGFAIPLLNPAGHFERGPVWLIGDAAGLAESLFGEGIYFALKSAELAARAVLDGQRDQTRGAYARLIESEILPELRAAAWLARLLYTFPDLTFRHLVRTAESSDLFAGLITGETGYRECLRKTLANLPRWIFAPKIEFAAPICQ